MCRSIYVTAMNEPQTLNKLLMTSVKWYVYFWLWIIYLTFHEHWILIGLLHGVFFYLFRIFAQRTPSFILADVWYLRLWILTRSNTNTKYCLLWNFAKYDLTNVSRASHFFLYIWICELRNILSTFYYHRMLFGLISDVSRFSLELQIINLQRFANFE